MKVVIFEPDYSEKQRRILRALAAGIPGAIVRPLAEYEPCDVAVIFGGIKYAYRRTWVKQTVLDRHHGRRLLMVESAFLWRGEYYQVGWGGTAGHADFNTFAATSLDRAFALGLPVKSQRLRPDGPVVVIGQLPRDVQVQDTDHKAWCRDTVDYYRAQGLPVIFRPHPKVDSRGEYGVDPRFFDSRSLAEVLEDARAVVTWNSTTGVESVLAGVPTIAMDRGSMAYDVAAHDLDTLDHVPGRGVWLARLAYAQWTLDEMRAGLPWRHLNRAS